jgi:hypothetical protein
MKTGFRAAGFYNCGFSIIPNNNYENHKTRFPQSCQQLSTGIGACLTYSTKQPHGFPLRERLNQLSPRFRQSRGEKQGQQSRSESLSGILNSKISLIFIRFRLSRAVKRMKPWTRCESSFIRRGLLRNSITISSSASSISPLSPANIISQQDLQGWS